MADVKLVELLRKDVEQWNTMRQQDPQTRVDLRGADLAQMNLAGINLNFADLQNAKFHRTGLGSALFLGADLSGADLREASLDAAHVVEANFDKADLSGARLSKGTLIKTNLLSARLPKCDLSGALVHECCLVGADFSGACLAGADLGESNFSQANLRGADLSAAKAYRADFRIADLTDANLKNADLFEAGFMGARLEGADLSGARLVGASLVRARVDRARFTGCRIYGISAWDLRGEPADQTDLIITPDAEADLMVESLDVAQFMYLLLHNPRIRDVIDTVTTKVVLILGRFSEQRKLVLDAIRERLKQHGYVPVIFDFARPVNRNLTETVQTIAHMSRFIVADLTEAKSIPQELKSIVPSLPSVPVVPLLAAGDSAYAMFDDFSDYNSVLDIVEYVSAEDIVASLPSRVIQPAEEAARKTIERRRRRQAD